jgi:hypothetical protein
VWSKSSRSSRSSKKSRGSCWKGFFKGSSRKEEKKVRREKSRSRGVVKKKSKVKVGFFLKKGLRVRVKLKKSF